MINDRFRNIFQTVRSNLSLLQMKLHKVKPLMFCPVYEMIEVKLSPFILHVPIQLLKDLSIFFAKHSETFDLDETEENLTQNFDEEIIDPEIFSQNGPSILFCRSIIFTHLMQL